ncbi:hypothetical protein [Lactococcus allomyrinae]|uniref:Uncharacterized protein n=1 Tax=Lactococcus allomyrinae TaxID=2419773 RepID=A0A387BNC3_9LACT|nr:hypothetical protein [Lactococcus allomyrinae]AYG00021.1 hypothetical protein D7I46_02300 [Lactococcus allomyrinae]
MGLFDIIASVGDALSENGDKATYSDEIKNDKRIQKMMHTDGTTHQTIKASKVKYKSGKVTETRSYYED